MNAHRGTARFLHRTFPAIVAALALGCHRDMYDQPRHDPLEESEFFADGRSARPLVPGTVYRGQPDSQSVLVTGRQDGRFVEELPVRLNKQLLERGRERFDIYCSVCHGRTGEGNGMVVLRGFRRPPSYHSDRLRGVPVGYLYDVVTHGFGAMPAYDHQIPLDDRWAIVAYVRALQFSQFAKAEELSPPLREKLSQAKR